MPTYKSLINIDDLTSSNANSIPVVAGSVGIATGSIYSKNDTDTGLCFPSPGKFTLFGNNAEILSGDSSGIVSKYKMLFQSGSVDAPSIVFEADTTTGFYKHPTNGGVWSFASGGVSQFEFGVNYIRAKNYGFLGKRPYNIGTGTTIFFLGINYSGMKYVTDAAASGMTTLTLPDANTLENSYYISVLSTNSHGITIAPNASNKIINGASAGSNGQSIRTTHDGGAMSLFLYNSKWYTEEIVGTWAFV